jgi:hypothetical protein
MQTDDLPAPLVQLSQALVSGIVIAHTKTMICFANQFKISSCRINKQGFPKVDTDFGIKTLLQQNRAGR